DRAQVLYVAGAAMPDAARATLAAARASRGAALLVLDDVDRVGEEVRVAFGELAVGLAERPMLVVATAGDVTLAEVLHARATLTLAPLDADGARAVARGYAAARGDAEPP